MERCKICNKPLACPDCENKNIIIKDCDNSVTTTLIILALITMVVVFWLGYPRGAWTKLNILTRQLHDLRLEAQSQKEALLSLTKEYNDHKHNKLNGRIK